VATGTGTVYTTRDDNGCH